MSKIQDMIKKYHNSKDKKDYRVIIEELQNTDMLWVSFSPKTKNHYVDYVQGSPAAFLFSEKSFSEDYKNHMKELGITVEIIECTKKDRLVMLADFFRSGIEAIVVDNGKTFLTMSLFDLINKPDYSHLPPEERPLVNGSLVCSANRFLQSLENKTITPDKELNMLVDVFSAKYMVPFVSIDENQNITIPGLSRSDGKNVVPFFTDLTELQKFDPENKLRHAITEFKQIQKFCEDGQTVVINPFSFNLTVTKETCDIILNAVKRLPDTDPTNRAVVFGLEQEPVEITSKFNLILNNTNNINSAYIKGIRKQGKAGYLIVLDCDDKNSEKIIKNFAEMAKTFTKDIPMEYVPLNSDIGKIAVVDTKPFFERVVIDLSDDEENK